MVYNSVCLPLAAALAFSGATFAGARAGSSSLVHPLWSVRGRYPCCSQLSPGDLRCVTPRFRPVSDLTA